MYVYTARKSQLFCIGSSIKRAKSKKGTNKTNMSLHLARFTYKQLVYCKTVTASSVETLKGGI